MVKLCTTESLQVGVVASLKGLTTAESEIRTDVCCNPARATDLPYPSPVAALDRLRERQGAEHFGWVTMVATAFPAFGSVPPIQL